MTDIRRMAPRKLRAALSVLAAAGAAAAFAAGLPSPLVLDGAPFVAEAPAAETLRTADGTKPRCQQNPRLPGCPLDPNRRQSTESPTDGGTDASAAAGGPGSTSDGSSGSDAIATDGGGEQPFLEAEVGLGTDPSATRVISEEPGRTEQCEGLACEDAGDLGRGQIN
ncbi:MAG: hypothetical protein AAFV62_14530 [Pseudomonadota bacterium]